MSTISGTNVVAVLQRMGTTTSSCMSSTRCNIRSPIGSSIKRGIGYHQVGRQQQQQQLQQIQQQYRSVHTFLVNNPDICTLTKHNILHHHPHSTLQQHLNPKLQYSHYHRPASYRSPIDNPSLQRRAASRHNIISRRWFGTWPKVRPRRIRVITMDVTGTLVSFRGSLEEHYVGSAKKCGVEFEHPDYEYQFSDAFRTAYQEMCTQYPCFGGNDISAKEWWKLVVLRSFELAGAEMTPIQKEIVFQRIYSTFGSHAAYEIFQDALPFLHWAQRNHLVCGVLSNADERYGDSILPMLGLTADHLQFQCYSKDYGYEKPSPLFYNAAINAAKPWLSLRSGTSHVVSTMHYQHLQDHSASDKSSELLASQVLHIGNDYGKDFEGARRAGLHAILLNRYDEHEKAEEWKRRGAPVFTDLSDVIYWLGWSKCELG